MTVQAAMVEMRARPDGGSLDWLPQPHPAAGDDAYRHERALAFAADPRKRENFERYARRRLDSADVDYLPIKLDIENVSRCNLRCRMCVVSDWHKGCRGADLEVDSFKRLIDEQYGLLEIKLQGIGEPLMQRDAVFEMIAYARARHIWVRTTTNATLLHLNDNVRKLLDSGVNEIQVSIDGASAEVYEHIRRGARFKQVAENCRMLNGACHDRGIRVTKMWTVVQEANLPELEAVIDFAAEAGFPCQVLSLELSDWALDHWNEANDRIAVRHRLSAERLEALVERGKDRGIDVWFWTVREKYRLGSPETLCRWPFERAYISSDLRVVPCCYVGNPDVFQVGEPLGETRTFSDIWQGPAFQEFRAAHLSGRLPEICRLCYGPAALDE